ncbi:MAG: aminopeptidase P family protein [Bryobacterales bacterium]|nr:aminopeptidase P family protein [Bryobacterales bacterium]
MNPSIEAIQEQLRAEGMDGWLFYDHHRRDPLAYAILGLPESLSATRRWYYFVPAEGEPRGLAHRIEARHLDSLPGPKRLYSTWQEQHGEIKAMLGDARRVAMQHSPNCEIPYVAMVDAGTVDLVRSFGVEVLSSANLVQVFHAQLSAEQYQSHIDAGKIMDRLRREAFALIGERLRSGAAVSEFDVKQFLLKGFEQNGLITDHGPIVAVNANASDPHYEPMANRSRRIEAADLVLIDMWARSRKPQGVYYDITWTGFCGVQPPAEIQNVFEIVKGARDAGFEAVRARVDAGESPMGYEIDDIVRAHIRDAGFEKAFIHRTGHSIGASVHGTGANIDNFETHDTRRLLPNTCFSIEPGIYLPAFGIRSEFNVFLRNGSASTTGEVQTALLRFDAGI